MTVKVGQSLVFDVGILSYAPPKSKLDYLNLLLGNHLKPNSINNNHSI